ncbi:MAG: ABC transporter permease [Alphaproteobacteria bacterium]|nr:ABC transporter permease [Alphaproteobacteria bacterium]
MTHPLAFPVWAEYALLPLLNLAAALIIAAFIVLAIGGDPLAAFAILLDGALGDSTGIGFTLYYATTYIFTGLAVAIPFHAGLFNIGGEGQAMIGGIGVTLLCLRLADAAPWLILPLAVLAAALGGAAWAFIPAWLQARRGSHVVITTIMFNFIAATLTTWLLVDILIAPGQSAPESSTFARALWLPSMQQVLAGLGVGTAATPLNVSVFLALLAAAATWLFLWRTPLGYEVRIVGQSEPAARQAGIGLAGVRMATLCLGGACAGLAAVNEVMGAEHRLILDFPQGSGFIGIAVALMGRNHPLGIALAALLFGILSQGGNELAFEMPALQRELIVVIEGLVILFCGALEHLFRPRLERLLGVAAR